MTMNSRPSVSALMVTIDPRDVRKRVIEGIEKKREQIKEVIVVTKKEVSCSKLEWADRVIVTNAPLGEARNIGVKACSSEYILMVDDDLVLLPNYFNCISFSAGAVGPKIKSATDDFWAELKAKELEAKCKSFSKLPCMGTIYKREVLKKIKFDPERDSGEDNDLHKRMVANGHEIKYRDKLGCEHYFTEGIYSNIKNEFKSGMEKDELFRVFGLMAISPIRGFIYYHKTERMGLPFFHIIKTIFKFAGCLWGTIT